MSNPILIVGSFNQDLTWYCRAFPQPGETTVGSFASGPGGKGSNQAVAAARTGIPTTFVGAVGKDVFGTAVKDFYAKEGIDCRLAEYEDAPTGNAGIFVSDSGENEIIVALGANLRLSPEDIADAVLEKAEVVVCQNEISIETTRAVLARARKLGKTTVLNPAPMTAAFKPEYMDNADILIPNETEFAFLLGAQGRESTDNFSAERIARLSAEELHRLCRTIGVPTLILTLGGKGCLVSTETDFRNIPAASGIEVVDTTGAGDAFVGGFASGLVQFQGDVFKAASYGNAVAALSVTKPGTAPAMPRKEEINRLFHSL